MISIFVSYRREDTSGHAGRLCDRLRAQFRPDQVFMDVDTINPGVDFVQVIEDAVGSCDVLLALIGKDWLTARDAEGNRRLDDPEDFIRVEIAAALTRKVPVIPVLVEDARMPAAAELPADLARLARINALDISDKRWEYDVGRLLTVLDGIPSSAERSPVAPLPTARPPSVASATGAAMTTPMTKVEAVVEGGSSEPPSGRSRKFVLLAVGALLLVLVASVFAIPALIGDNEPTGPSITAGAVAAPAIDASGRPVTYEPSNAMDGDPTTAWRVEGDGRGVTLSIDLARTASVRRVGVLPGYAKIDSLDHTDRFSQNRRISRARYRFDDGTATEHTFLDRPVIQFIEVRATTRKIVIEILETIPGDPAFDYTPISEIIVDTVKG